jgi:hypothetical protein
MFVSTKVVSHLTKTRGRGVWVPAFAGTTNLRLAGRGICIGAERPRPDLGDATLQRGLPRIGQDGGARLGYGAGKVGKRQHANEGRLGEAVDDDMPVGQAVAIDAFPHPAITLFSGRR